METLQDTHGNGISLPKPLAVNPDQVSRVDSIIHDATYKATRSHPMNLVFTRDVEGHYRYNSEAAYVASIASAWAYSEAQTLTDQLTDLTERELACVSFEASNPSMYLDTDAYLVYTTDGKPESRFGILVYRGTEFSGVGDLLADAYVEMIEYPSKADAQGLVHGGFYYGMMAVWKRVYKMLVDADLPQLIITGHSLGAALAVMAAAQICYEAEQQIDPRFGRIRDSLRGVYTFGQPAVGNAGFSDWINNRFGSLTFRHMYGRDVVPFLPTSDVNTLYQHFKCGVWTCGPDETQWTGPNIDKPSNVAPYFAVALGLAVADFVARRIPFRLSLTKLLLDRAIRYSLDDHSPLNYVRVSRNSHLISAPT